MVRVKVFNSRVEAEVARSFLASRGVDSLIQADDQGGMRPFLALSAGVNLMVSDEDAALAKRLLESDESDGGETYG